MSEYVEQVTRLSALRAAEALRAHGMETVVVESAADALKAALSYLKPGQSASLGGSVTLAEIGLTPYLESHAGEYEYLDRYAKGADVNAVFHAALSADVYFSGANAITEDGKIVNVDGNGNRVAALVYGPATVVIVAGANKLVKDLDAAADRVRLYAAPANAIRLNCDTPCAKTGKCVAYKPGKGFDCDGCASPSRICRHYHIIAAPKPGRVKVVLSLEPLGL